MITVVIPTLNGASTLAATIASLGPGFAGGIIRQVIVADGGSNDDTLSLARDLGAEIVVSERGRGKQLRLGAAAARFPWLLFLHADTVIDQGWDRELEAFIDRVECGRYPPGAAAFTFALDDRGFLPRLIEVGVLLRCRLLRLPYGDQGLLIPRWLYDQVGGFKPMALMEDVDLVRRLGRRQLSILRTRAVTSAVRYRRDGYANRTARNLTCLALYYLKAPMPLIERLYSGRND